jgi:hypothetical protein
MAKAQRSRITETDVRNAFAEAGIARYHQTVGRLAFDLLRVPEKDNLVDVLRAAYDATREPIFAEAAKLAATLQSRDLLGTSALRQRLMKSRQSRRDAARERRRKETFVAVETHRLKNKQSREEAYRAVILEQIQQKSLKAPSYDAAYKMIKRDYLAASRSKPTRNPVPPSNTTREARVISGRWLKLLVARHNCTFVETQREAVRAFLATVNIAKSLMELSMRHQTEEARIKRKTRQTLLASTDVQSKRKVRRTLLEQLRALREARGALDCELDRAVAQLASLERKLARCAPALCDPRWVANDLAARQAIADGCVVRLDWAPRRKDEVVDYIDPLGQLLGRGCPKQNDL